MKISRSKLTKLVKEELDSMSGAPDLSQYSEDAIEAAKYALEQIPNATERHGAAIENEIHQYLQTGFGETKQPREIFRMTDEALSVAGVILGVGPDVLEESVYQPASSAAEDHPAYAQDDELKDIGVDVANLLEFTEELHEKLEYMGRRYGELAHAGTYSRMVMKAVETLSDKYRKGLNNISGRMSEGFGEPTGAMGSPPALDDDIAKGYVHRARGVVNDAISAGATREQIDALLKAVQAAIEYSFAGKGL